MESSFNDPVDEIDDAVAPEIVNPSIEPLQVSHEVDSSLPTAIAAVDDQENPSIPLGEFLPIAPQQVTLDRLIGLIVAAVINIGGIVGLVIYFFSIASPDWIFWLVLGLSGIAMIGLSVYAFAWPPIEVRHTSWRLDARGLEIRRGVFWKHQVSIPSSRVQHIDVSQGPLQRPFGLATLTVHTAGTANASVEFAGLNFDTATHLRDQLVEQREALNVV